MFKINIKFLILLIASYAYALIQGGNLPYRIFHGFLITFIVSLIYIMVKKRSINIKMKFDKKIYNAGDNEEFITIVKNDGIFPIPYFVLKNKTLATLDTKYNGDAIWLNPEESKWISSTVKFNRRGIYNLGELEVSIKDLFCIFESKKKMNISVPVKVYTKVFELNKVSINGSDIFVNAVSNKSNIEDLYNTREIRKYNQGDNLKRVNWKVSAKHGELYVRNLETVSGEESNIFLNMNKENMISGESGIHEEQLISLCASIVNYIQLRGVKTKLFINSLVQRSFDISSRDNFNELLEFFLTQSSDSENSFARFINSNINKIPRLSWIGIITIGVNTELRDNLIIMKDKGYNITVFYSVASFKDLSNMEILRKAGVECYSFNELIKNEESKVSE